MLMALCGECGLLLLYLRMLVLSLQLMEGLRRVLRSFLDRDESNGSRSAISSFSEDSSAVRECFTSYGCSILCAAGADRQKIESNHVPQVSGTVVWRGLMSKQYCFELESRIYIELLPYGIANTAIWNIECILNSIHSKALCAFSLDMSPNTSHHLWFMKVPKTLPP